MKLLKREIGTFIFLFFFLSIFMHFSAWIDHPLEHFKTLSHSSLGVYHPFSLTLGIYLLVTLVKGLVIMIRKLKSKIFSE